MKKRWVVSLSVVLVAVDIALAASDDFVQRLLAADELHRQGDNAGAEHLAGGVGKDRPLRGRQPPQGNAALSHIGFAGCASRVSGAHWSVSVTRRFLRRGKKGEVYFAVRVSGLPLDQAKTAEQTLAKQIVGKL